MREFPRLGRPGGTQDAEHVRHVERFRPEGDRIGAVRPRDVPALDHHFAVGVPGLGDIMTRAGACDLANTRHASGGARRPARRPQGFIPKIEAASGASISWSYVHPASHMERTSSHSSCASTAPSDAVHDCELLVSTFGGDPLVGEHSAVYNQLHAHHIGRSGARKEDDRRCAFR